MPSFQRFPGPLPGSKGRTAGRLLVPPAHERKAARPLKQGRAAANQEAVWMGYLLQSHSKPFGA